MTNAADNKTNDKKAMKQVILEVVVSLCGTALVICFNLLTQVILETDTISKYKADYSLFKKLLAVQFDIMIIAATMLIGAVLSDATLREKLFWHGVSLTVGTVVLLVLAVIASVFDTWHPDAMRYGIPDLISLVLLFIAVRAVAGVRNS